MLVEQSELVLGFNPRPREEGDNIVANVIPHEKSFNPRPREEGDYALVSGVSFGLWFQSTPS